MEISAVEFVARLLGVPIAFAIDPFALMLVYGFALRGGLISDAYLLQPAFAGFADDGFLSVVLILYVAHVVADKIPPIAHALDAVYVVVKPLAAALLGFWAVNALNPDTTLHVVTLSVVVLGSITITTTVHAMRSTVRLVTSAKSFGLLMPVVSTFENVVGAATAGLVIFRPELALVLFLAVGVPASWVCYRIVRRVGRGAGAVRARLRG